MITDYELEEWCRKVVDSGDIDFIYKEVDEMIKKDPSIDGRLQLILDEVIKEEVNKIVGTLIKVYNNE